MVKNPSGPILIFGANEELRKKEIEKLLKNAKLRISKNNPDLLEISPPEGKKSIGIDQIRAAITFLSERPFSHKNKAVIIYKSELMTIEAQNALLKTLEEPPAFAILILSAKTEESLLPTIISRCRKLDVHREILKEEEPTNLISINEILGMSKGKRLDWVVDFSKEDKETIIQTLENWVREERSNLKKAKEKNNKVQNIESLLQVLDDLQNTNISTKIALEYLTLKLE